jgi:hypothetical protein
VAKRASSSDIEAGVSAAHEHHRRLAGGLAAEPSADARRLYAIHAKAALNGFLGRAGAEAKTLTQAHIRQAARDVYESHVAEAGIAEPIPFDDLSPARAQLYYEYAKSILLDYRHREREARGDANPGPTDD